SVVAREGEQAGVAPMGSPGKGLLDELGGSAPWYLVIEHDLPQVKALRGASRNQFFDALPASIKEWRQVSPQLAGSATIVCTEWARDILRSAFGAVGPDCPLLAKVLRSVIAADPNEASALMELALELAPQCAEAFKLGPGGAGDGGGGGDGFGPGGPPNQSGVPFQSGGGASGNVISICHNGRTIFVSPAGAAAHLRNHRGDTLGRCVVTATQNR
ncbi:MAG: hypothetical protein LC642_07395, partial [Verrucomicrobiaceae bacterium]|nr:hypothetical protein [Verrucomicrobiaceae bacterium]